MALRAGATTPAPMADHAIQADDARVQAVADALGHRCSDAVLLRRAATHASILGPQAGSTRRRDEANERLEFLGDALLGAALAELIYRRFPDADEGRLSRLKSELVSRSTLAVALDALGLGPYCRVGGQMGRVWPTSVKANLMESLLAALWMDGGWVALSTAVERMVSARLDDPETGREDPRMRLQVWCLEHHQRLPDYTCERSGGSDHDPQFRSDVAIAGRSASGRGSSRRRAEAAAADALLELIATPAPSAPAPPVS